MVLRPVVEWLVILVLAGPIEVWSATALHMWRRVKALHKSGFSHTDEIARIVFSILPILFLVVVIAIPGTLAGQDAASTFMDMALMFFLLTAAIASAGAASRIIPSQRRVAWKDEFPPQAPWTGWRVTEDGDRFFDQATTEELQCDGLAIYISGHRTARNMKIGSIGGQGMLIASITMSATPEGKNFQELASNLEKAVPDGAQAVLAQLQNHARWYIKQPLEGFTRELHRSNPDIRFALTFAFEQAPELVCWEQKPT